MYTEGKIMNISQVRMNTPIFCGNESANTMPAVQCSQCTCPSQATNDTVEISTSQKAKNACKKGINFLKNNKKAIGATAKAIGTGILTACTILGANQLMSKVSKADTSKLASKLAVIGGITAGAADLIKNRKAFNKTQSDKQ